MKIIGLTGGSGTGKSTVSQLLQARGAGAVDADAIYHMLCAESTPMRGALRDAFGAGVLHESGGLDRPALAKIVFADPQKLRLLGELTTPYIRQASLAAFDTLKAHDVVLYDAPTLFETGMDSLCQDVIGVLARKELRVQRIMARDHLSRPAALARIEAQPPDSFYRTRCRYLIRNDGSCHALEPQADVLYQSLIEGEPI